MAYGPNLLGTFHQTGTMVGKILQGLRPADLPVERPTKFEMVINLKGSLLAAADVLKAAGVTVLGAIVCGKTIYDLNTKHFGEQELDLTEELADWHGYANI
jgi:hypothetical protein